MLPPDDMVDTPPRSSVNVVSLAAYSVGSERQASAS
jgi:hypothetical protein